eukprot:scaffold95533_cov36-Tisochrysis_lutea.AAC.4
MDCRQRLCRCGLAPLVQLSAPRAKGERPRLSRPSAPPPPALAQLLRRGASRDETVAAPMVCPWYVTDSLPHKE